MHLAKRLLDEGSDVSILESDPELVEEAQISLEADVRLGNAMRVASWKAVRAEEMDYVIAATNDDATNMMSALIADRFNIKRKIARVRSLEFDAGSVLPPELLKIDLMVHPEELVAKEIEQLTKRASCNDLTDVGDGNMQVLALRVREDSLLSGQTPRELAMQYQTFDFRIVALARGITTTIPQAETVIQPGDQVFILARTEDMPQLMSLMDLQQNAVNRLLILGGGLIGKRVAELLQRSVEVRLIERDARAAEELAAQLPYTQVLNGDGTDLNTLINAGILDSSTFIATTGDNETNIISCLLAKHLMNRDNRDHSGEKGKTIALVNKEDLLVLASTIGLDIALNVKISAANEILKFIRRNELLAVAHLHGVDAEVVELVAKENSPITKRPLRKLASYFQDHQILIGGVKHDGYWSVAVGGTHVQVGDRVIAVCTSRHLSEVRRLLSGSE
jgi:trk system potassium uptake protein TrkA